MDELFEIFKSSIKNFFEEPKSWLIPILLPIIGMIFGFYINYSLLILSLLFSIPFALYLIGIIRKNKLLELNELFNLRNLVDFFIAGIKGLITVLILSIPLIIITIILLMYIINVSEGLINLDINNLFSSVFSLFLIVYILIIVHTAYSYFISPAFYLSIIKNSIKFGLKNFYKIPLTIEYFLANLLGGIFMFGLMFIYSTIIIIVLPTFKIVGAILGIFVLLFSIVWSIHYTSLVIHYILTNKLKIS